MQYTTRQNWLDFLSRLPSLFLGLFLFSMGLVANLYSDLGMSPWGVLSVGVEKSTFLSFGQATQVIGLIILLMSWKLEFAPGFGTLCNMYFMGFFVDIITSWDLIPKPFDPLEKFMLLFMSIILIGAGSFFYLRVRLGAGPRDGLMIGIVKMFNRPISQVRSAIEIIVLIIGFLLGGPVGIGTVISAFGVGLAVQIAFRLGRYDKNSKHLDISTLLNYLFGRSSLL